MSRAVEHSPIFWLAAWMLAWSTVAFGLFGFDKWSAGRRGPRVAEATLLLACVCGGWPGGLAGIILFRHKSAKASFQFKFALAALASLAAAWAALALARVT